METILFTTPESYYVSFSRTENMALSKTALLQLLAGIFQTTEEIIKPLSLTAIRNYTREGFPYSDRSLEVAEPLHTLMQNNYSGNGGTGDIAMNPSAENMDTDTIVSWLDGLLVDNVPDRVASFATVRINASAARVFADTVGMYKEENTLESLCFANGRYWIEGPSEQFPYCPVEWNLLHDAEIYSLTFSINYSPYLDKGAEEYRKLKKCFHSLLLLGWEPDLYEHLFELKK